MENRTVEITIEQKAHAMMIPGMGPGGDSMDFDFQGMIEKILPKNVSRRQMTVAEARRVLFEQETEAMINAEKVNAQAIELAENVGIIFVDEMDKVVASEGGRGADVSRQGVQRDLLPIVEGTTVNTRYGYVRTDHVLFVAAGAFHKAKPSRSHARTARPFPDPRRAEGSDEGRLRPHPHRAEKLAHQAVHGAAENRRRRSRFSRRMQSMPSPATHSTSTSARKTSAPAGSTRSSNACSKNSPSKPPT